MTDFTDRQRAFESQFARDAELQFRVMARRDKLVGLWAAEKLGLNGDEADEYARTVVKADFEEPGDEDVVRKVAADFAAAGVGATEHDIRVALGAQAGIARHQVMEAM